MANNQNSFFTIQNIIIIIMIISYLFIFLAYKHDVDQLNNLIEDIKLNCNETCAYLNKNLIINNNSVINKPNKLNITFTNNG